MKKYFEKELPLHIENYEERLQQVMMAEIIKETINNGKGNLIIEAGTGIGKTFAYLMPLAEYAITNKKKVFVSTYTKALQQQIYKKDLPVIKKIFPELKYEVAFGAENYMCMRRAAEFKNKGTLFMNTNSINEMLEFLKDGAGLRGNSRFHIPDEAWSEVNRMPELCRDESCEDFFKCYYFKMKRKLTKAHIIVINHHLFFSDMAVDNKILPASSIALFDEGHRVEDVARDMLSRRFSTQGYLKLISELEEFLRQKDRLTKKTYSNLHSHLISARKDFTEFSKAVYNNPELRLYEKEAVLIDFPFKDKIDIHTRLKDTLFELAESIAYETGRNEDLKKYYEFLLSRCNEYISTMEHWQERDEEEFFYWVAMEGKDNAVFYITPYRIDKIFAATVLDNYDSTIFTSATLSTGKDFDYIIKQLGFSGPRTKLLKSPFDYKKQALLYLESDIASPQDSNYSESLANKLADIIGTVSGNMLILFTNTEFMKKTYKTLKRENRDREFMMQGELNPNELIANFKNRRSVLFATNTFWQGIDISGNILKCVVITRLPFEMPEHPLQKAIHRYIEDRGDDAFREYSLPRAIFMLKQGFGRLIRSKEDTGVVMILDKRITTKSYGREFIAALPEVNITRNIDDVKEFFNQ